MFVLLFLRISSGDSRATQAHDALLFRAPPTLQFYPNIPRSWPWRVPRHIFLLFLCLSHLPPSTFPKGSRSISEIINSTCRTGLAELCHQNRENVPRNCLTSRHKQQSAFMCCDFCFSWFDCCKCYQFTSGEE